MERRSTTSYAPATRRWRALLWHRAATTGVALAGAIGAATAVPLALSGASPGATAGWWALSGVSATLAAGGAALRLRIAAFGPEGAKRPALEQEIWDRHRRDVPGGVVVDAPGQERWRFSEALADVERRVGDVPAPERARLLAEARTVAVAASRLLLDAPTMGQARLVVFHEARFGRLDLTADDSLVPGAAVAYRRLLDDAERQLRELASALTDLSRSRASDQSVSEHDVARLHSLVSLAELDVDPTTRGPEPAIVRAAERLRAQASAHRDLDGLEG